jgi:peptidoglycan/xylan/chitin deacetylase (PgdA/CDA1 family)
VNEREPTQSIRTAIRKTVSLSGEYVDRKCSTLRTALTNGLSVFLFHNVSSEPSPFQRKTQSFTTPVVFREQIAWIRNRFTIIGADQLVQLGGTARLPSNAALLTFDDCWSGIFEEAVPYLIHNQLPALCFLNMATIGGDPDFAAVEYYERELGLQRARPPYDAQAAAQRINAIRHRYVGDFKFAEFQGRTATLGDLRNAAASGLITFGSHLYHHWAVSDLTADAFCDSFVANRAALSAFGNQSAAIAIPYGDLGVHAEQISSASRALGTHVMFVGTGSQNYDDKSFVLDRVWFPPEPSGPADWWYSVHRKRVMSLIGRSWRVSRAPRRQRLRQA